MNLEQITQGNQTLLPLEYEGEHYYVRLVRRGSRLDCSGVFKFEITDGADRIRPEFRYQNMDKTKIRRVILVAKQTFERAK
jgi:hypothetical protein